MPPLRDLASHLIHWHPGREGSSSDYPILQGCMASSVQGHPLFAMLTLRREAKTSPVTHPLKYPLPGGSEYPLCPISSMPRKAEGISGHVSPYLVEEVGAAAPFQDTQVLGHTWARRALGSQRSRIPCPFIWEAHPAAQIQST